MIYFIDANVLINANRDYYSMDQVPEYWQWLLCVAKESKAKVPLEIYEEILGGNKTDPLYIWAKENEKDLKFKEEIDTGLISEVIRAGYAPDLTDTEVGVLGRDPYIIACAIGKKQSCIVTAEVSKPSRKRQNRHLPDVCTSLGIRWCTPFKFNRDLGFTTSWKR